MGVTIFALVALIVVLKLFKVTVKVIGFIVIVLLGLYLAVSFL
jgi:hypothetical protein